jgi:hypothetical protein
MEVRRATPGDIPGVLRLQAACFVGNLRPEEREGGFLSAEFTAGQLEDIAKEGWLIVGLDGDQIVGFLCAAGCAYYGRFPMLEALIRQFPGIRLDGMLFESSRAFIYGPVCIDPSRRGRGLLLSLYRELLKSVATSADHGIALISKRNCSSFQAHVRKLGMTPVGNYTFAGREYNIVAFQVPNVRVPFKDDDEFTSTK